MRDAECVGFLQWALPRLGLCWSGFRKARGQVCKRIARRLAALGLGSAGEYRAYLETHPGEWQLLDSACRVSISRFLRDREVFEFLATDLFPEAAMRAASRPGRLVCAWSAGCAGGEEAFTAMLVWRFQAGSRFPDVGLSILGTDAEEAQLARARAACYPGGSLKGLAPAWRDSAFESRDGLFCVRPEFRDGVAFDLQDIRREAPELQFDIVFCRNLTFTYFGERAQREVLARIASRLAPGGALVIGRKERLPPGSTGFVGPVSRLPVYRLASH